jgi:hypothetical protein
MALTRSFTITQQDGGETAIAVNTTVYGTPNQDRDDAAEYALWSKTNSAGNRTFNNPDQGSVLTALQYTVETEIDGWYELIIPRIQPYNNATAYVEQQSSGSAVTQYASIVYYQPTNKVYKCIAPTTGNLPTNTNFWVELSITDLPSNLDNTNIDVYYKNFNAEYLTNNCIRDKFSDAGCECDEKNRNRNQQLLYMKQSADINFANGNPELFEKIIRQLETDCTQC